MADSAEASQLFYHPGPQAAGAAGKEQTAVFPPPPSPPDCCQLPCIMYAEIREKEREAMKGEKKINIGEEIVYPRMESLLLF